MKKDSVPVALAQAITQAKESSTVKFDASVELHFNLDIDPKQADQTLRVTTNLPHGTGKDVKIAVMAAKKIAEADLELSEADLKKLEKGEIRPKRDFDILIVEPEFMGKMAKLGAILGPAGVMPSPKTGTVTDKAAEAVAQFKKGKITLRNELEAPLLHTLIGKVSFTDKQLTENFMEIWGTLKSNKPQKAKPEWITACFISTSMGPSIQIDINNL
jgi:large subunit ribosomal protein L1